MLHVGKNASEEGHGLVGERTERVGGENEEVREDTLALEVAECLWRGRITDGDHEHRDVLQPQ